MWSEEFSIFGVGIPVYGLSKALALMVGAWLVGRAFMRIGYDDNLAHAVGR